MKKTFCLLALVAASALPAAAGAQEPVAAVSKPTPAEMTGKMLYTADGRHIASVYSVEPDGSPQVIWEGRLVTVPASTVTVDGGKVLTSMTKMQLALSR